ncbi:CBO0543 family protein [Geobacillus thermoleovorans]|uniref:CBO0543 family protein n=1 Tax=Geobacillus thermoleovorans TaxID=33941 RepID=UPI00207890D7|nr:CBO0543 family protein [Geobacillus thermoleovorans]
MEQWILWLLAAVGIGLLGLSFRFLSPREVWFSFLLNAYISSLAGLIVSGAGMLAYPVRLFPDYTNDVIFEYLLYPVVSVYVYGTSRRSGWKGIWMQCAAYTGGMTAVEILLERHTDLIEYHTWKWGYSFVSMFVVTLAVRVMAGRLLKENG